MLNDRLNAYRRWRQDPVARYTLKKKDPVAGIPLAPGLKPSKKPKPQAPQAQAPQARPFDALYENTASAINTGLANTQAGLQYQEGRVRQDFGLDDTSNPFNRAKMLQRAYEQRTRGNTTSLAAQGQLYSGALQNAQDESRFQFDQSHDALSREYADALAAIQQRRLEAQDEAQYGLLDAEGKALGRALSERPEGLPTEEDEARAHAREQRRAEKRAKRQRRRARRRARRRG